MRVRTGMVWISCIRDLRCDRPSRGFVQNLFNYSSTTYKDLKRNIRTRKHMQQHIHTEQKQKKKKKNKKEDKETYLNTCIHT